MTGDSIVYTCFEEYTLTGVPRTSKFSTLKDKISKYYLTHDFK
jgi:hypothetical protein